MSTIRRLRPLLLGLLVLAAGILLWVRTTPEVPAPLVDPAANATRGDFTVDTADGPLSLSSLRGRVVVVYFGYTACPDICPTTLATLAAAVRQLSAAEQEQVTALMVSVDPERDTPERLGAYVHWFHPSFHAGTRPPEAVATIARDWGVVYRKVGGTGSALAYMVDHSTESYLVAADGRYLGPIPHGTPATAVAERLRSVLAAP